MHALTTMTKYIVVYRLNDRVVEKEFDSMTLAVLEQIKLEQYKMNATIHLKE